MRRRVLSSRRRRSHPCRPRPPLSPFFVLEAPVGAAVPELQTGLHLPPRDAILVEGVHTLQGLDFNAFHLQGLMAY